VGADDRILERTGHVGPGAGLGAGCGVGGAARDGVHEGWSVTRSAAAERLLDGFAAARLALRA
jgi:hypothetical protein